jgi:putative tricarboxylic transport membrane protein
MTEADEVPHAEHAPEDREHPLVSSFTMEIVTSLSLIGLAAVVIWECVRLGFGWQDGLGPAPGFFPFIVASLMAGASLFNIVRVLRFGPEGDDPVFVTTAGFGRVLSVLLPLLVYIVAIHYIGIYAASGFFIALFMIVIGRESMVKAVAVGAAVPLVLFFMFERWFLVPLPKGPIEAALGF